MCLTAFQAMVILKVTSEVWQQNIQNEYFSESFIVGV
jgi:hypothetical protein